LYSSIRHYYIFIHALLNNCIICLFCWTFNFIVFPSSCGYFRNCVCFMKSEWNNILITVCTMHGLIRTIVAAPLPSSYKHRTFFYSMEIISSVWKFNGNKKFGGKRIRRILQSSEKFSEIQKNLTEMHLMSERNMIF
jgi:hypothetical protein